tara:strand:+ start:809 stop:1030 length:222 start_codon:yes stop_codon:yes gene_type:complete
MDKNIYKEMDLREGMRELKETEINLNQQDMQQQIDMLQMEVKELREQFFDQIKAFSIAINLIRDILEQKHGGK